MVFERETERENQPPIHYFIPNMLVRDQKTCATLYALTGSWNEKAQDCGMGHRHLRQLHSSQIQCPPDSQA